MHGRSRSPLAALVLVAVGVGVYAQTAGADGPRPSLAASASASSFALASGSAAAPLHIDASEHVDSVVVAPLVRRPNMARYFTIVSSDAEAKAIAAGGSVDFSARAADLCYGVGAHGTMERPTVTMAIPLPFTAPAASSARPGFRPPPPRPPPRPPRTVYMIRVVRTSIAGGKARLDTSDVWVDLDTGGSRLVERTSETFSLAAQGPAGFDVYSKAENGGDAMKFLVVTPALGGDERAALAQVGQDSVEATGCGHLVVKLKARENGGAMANVIGVVQLPPDPNDHGTGDEDSPDQQDDGTSTAPRTRVRPVRANLSVSRVASDSQPVVAVSFSWAGPDRAASLAPAASASVRFVE